MGWSIDSFPVNYAASGSASSATTLIASTNLGKYRAGKVTITGTWVGTIKVQGSKDNSTFHDIPIWDGASASPSLAVSTTSNGTFLFNCIDTYIKVLFTAYTSGTATANLEMSAWPLPVPFSVTAGSSSTVAGGEAHDATLSSAPVPIGGYAKATAPSAVSADGDAVNAWFSTTGCLNVADGAGSLTVDATGAAAHDAAASGAPVLLGGYAKATAPSAVSADGDVCNLWCSTTGVLQVGDGLGSLTVDATGAAAHDAAASGAPVLLGGYAKATAPSAVSADGDACNLWCTTTGELNVVNRGAAAHDAAVSGAPVLIGGYAKATAPADVSATGDAVNIWCDLAGRVQVGDGGGTLTVDATGAAAHDAAASGAPVLLGGYAKATAPSAVSADGDACNLWCTTTGELNTVARGPVAHDGVAAGAPVLLAGRAQNTLPSAVSADADVAYLSTTQKGQLRVIQDFDANAVGATLYSNTALNATKAEVTDTANSRVSNIFIYNPSNAVAYLQIFDLDADDVTVGSTTPTQVLAVPTLLGMNFPYPTPKKFTTGLTIAGTTTATGSTNPSTALVVAIDYIV